MDTLGIILSTAGGTIVLLAGIIGFFFKDYIKRFQNNFDKLFQSFSDLTDRISMLSQDLKVLKTSYAHRDISYKEKFSSLNKSIYDIELEQKKMKQDIWDLQKNNNGKA
jgi:hypothetical protein